MCTSILKVARAVRSALEIALFAAVSVAVACASSLAKPISSIAFPEDWTRIAVTSDVTASNLILVPSVVAATRSHTGLPKN